MAKKKKICLFKICNMLILMYRVETWTLTKAHISRLMAQEIRFLGKLIMERIRNNKIMKINTLEGKLTNNSNMIRMCLNYE
jgi:hypothetical protein